MGFQSTLSLRRATRAAASTYHSGYYFNPRSPCGERQVQSCLRQLRKYFNPRSPCGERHYLSRAKVNRFDISIHALLAESDSDDFPVEYPVDISIHALLAESDTTYIDGSKIQTDFNPRSPCGERPPQTVPQLVSCPISIHALLAESDRLWRGDCGDGGNFNPRSPCGERQTAAEAAKTAADFNPRSPCGERPAHCYRRHRRPDFNPRSPCGERRQSRGKPATWPEFQSTLSLRRATIPRSKTRRQGGISIHALLAESDRLIGSMTIHLMEFQSTLSLRRATPDKLLHFVLNPISIHALLAESDSKYHQIGPIVSV